MKQTVVKFVFKFVFQIPDIVTDVKTANQTRDYNDIIVSCQLQLPHWFSVLHRESPTFDDAL